VPRPPAGTPNAPSPGRDRRVSGPLLRPTCAPKPRAGPGRRPILLVRPPSSGQTRRPAPPGNRGDSTAPSGTCQGDPPEPRSQSAAGRCPRESNGRDSTAPAAPRQGPAARRRPPRRGQRPGSAAAPAPHSGAPMPPTDPGSAPRLQGSGSIGTPCRGVKENGTSVLGTWQSDPGTSGRSGWGVGTRP